MHCIMKITVIISIALVTQVSASFFDVFQGAVLSVQTSFGKLLSDVVADVQLTVDCTILAVEHVLSLNDDATDRYYEKCKGATEPNTASNNDGQNIATTTVMPKLEFPVEISNEDLKKNIPAEISAKVNETLSNILDDYNIKNRLGVEDILAKETESLADVSVLVKEELDKFSSEVNSDNRKIEQNDSPPLTIETVLEKVKLMQDMEQDSKNSSEANEIHQVVDQVLEKLDEIEETEVSDNVRIEEILKDMQSQSNDSFSDLEKHIDEWKEEKSKYFDDITGKMEEEKEMAEHLAFEDASNSLSEGSNRILNSANQLNNTVYIVNNPEITLLPYKYDKESENTTDYLPHVTVNHLNITSTGFTPNNESSTTAIDIPSVQINNTEQTINTSNSIQVVQESSNLMGVQSSFMLSSTSTDNPITPSSPEAVLTTDSYLTTQNMLIDQPESLTSVDENTTLPLTDHFTESTSETISTMYSIFSNMHEDIEHYNKNTMMDTDSTVTTHEFFIPHTLLIDEYDMNEKRSDEKKTIDLINPKPTSESPIVSTVVLEDFKITHEPSKELNSSDHIVARPLIDVTTKSITSNLGSSRISRRINEESQRHSSNAISSTTEVNKEYSVLTTIKPAYTNDQIVNDKTSQDYDYFFNSATNNSPIHKKAVKDARKIIEDSKYTDLIMNSILKHKKTGISIFNYPFPANFGK